MNTIILAGRAFQDSDLFTTSTGKQYTNLKISISKGKDKEGKYQSDIFSVFVWDKTAKYVNEYVHKGDIVSIEGRVGIRKETDNQGKNRYSYYLVADKVTKYANSKPVQASNQTNTNATTNVTMDDISTQLNTENMPWE